MEEIKEVKPTSIKELAFRLVIFLVAFIGFVTILACGLRNPQSTYPEGFGYVVVGSIIFGLLSLVEAGTLFLQLIKRWLG